MYIGQKLSLDLGSSSPVKMKVLSINESNVKVEYLFSTPGRTEEFTLEEMRNLCSYDEYIATDPTLDKLRQAYIAGFNDGNCRSGVLTLNDVQTKFNAWVDKNYDPLC